MAIELNHTIVPSLDKEASAMFFARIFGLRYATSRKGPAGHFAPGGGLGQRFQSLFRGVRPVLSRKEWASALERRGGVWVQAPTQGLQR